MTHLEQLLYEYFDWRGYLVKENVKVGKRKAGGYEMELDIVAYDPHSNHLIHIETSLDSHSWAQREERFKNKFSKGKKYICKEVFTWLDRKSKIDRLIILPTTSKTGKLGRVAIRSVDEYYSEIIEAIREKGTANAAAIPEKYPLLRTIQFVISGYHKSPLSICEEAWTGN